MSTYPFQFGFATAVMQEDLVNSCFRFVQAEEKTQAIAISNWALWLMRGINPGLLKIWDKRNGWSKQKFERRLNAYFSKYNKELIDQCEKYSINTALENSFENGFKKSYLSIDYRIIEDILHDDESGLIFNNVFANAIAFLEKNNIETVVFINQFSSEEIRNNYNEKKIEESLSDWSRQINKALKTKGSPEATYKLQLLTEKTPEQWRFFIDRSVSLGENYGGTKMVRFNIEWAEVMPSKDEFREDRVDKYIEVIKYAKSKGLKVLICVNHMTWPLWADGWENPEMVESINLYSKKLFEYLKSAGVIAMVDKVLIINEPGTVLSTSYILNVWPPFKGLSNLFLQSLSGIAGNYDFLTNIVSFFWRKNPYLLALRNMQAAHMKVYDTVKSIQADLPVSSSQIIMGNRKLHKASIIDVFGVTQTNRGVYRWLDTIREKAFRRGKTYFDFYAPQLYGSFLLSYKFVPTGGKNQSVMDSEDIRYKQVNGSLDDQSIFVVRLLEVATRSVEDGIRFGITSIEQLPKITFTEFGYVAGMIANRRYAQYIMNNINQFYSYLPTDIDYMLRWAPDDNWEWDSGYMNWARFGDVNYDGTPKPLGEDLENRFNYYDERIFTAMEGLRFMMVKYRTFLQKKLVSTDYSQESHNSIDVLSAKIRLADAYIEDARGKKFLQPL